MAKNYFCCVGSFCMSLKGSQSRFAWCSYMYQNWVGLKASHTWSAPLVWGFSSTSLCDIRNEIFIGITHTHTRLIQTQTRHTPTTFNSVFAANSAAQHEERCHFIAQKAVLVFLEEITQSCQKKERSRPRFPCFIYLFHLFLWKRFDRTASTPHPHFIEELGSFTWTLHEQINHAVKQLSYSGKL